MAGFLVDPIQDINLIADNLRDRYESGFPVLKELIQNTDDSGASELHYGISPGISSAAHPLLLGPGLFFINNGKFTEKDYRGIRSFALNSKAADQSSIGKFGLGMKSVFHFCEAFFFLAHDGTREYNEILNPWSSGESGSSLHSDWDQFDNSDASLLRQQLMKITDVIECEAGHYFILWIPLRQKRHLARDNGESIGAIASQYPGDDLSLLSFLDEANITQKIAALFPLLSSLRRSVYWGWDENSHKPVSRFEIVLSPAAQRLTLAHLQDSSLDGDSQSPQTPQAKLSGSVTVSMSGELKPIKLSFSGIEGLEWIGALSEIHRHELWPWSYTRDDYGRECKARDKAKPHSTVVFSRVNGEPSLTTTWAVFLPLDEKTATEKVPCSDSHAYRLTLHGYFFVDAGRAEYINIATTLL